MTSWLTPTKQDWMLETNGKMLQQVLVSGCIPWQMKNGLIFHKVRSRCSGDTETSQKCLNLEFQNTGALLCFLSKHCPDKWVSTIKYYFSVVKSLIHKEQKKLLLPSILLEKKILQKAEKQYSEKDSVCILPGRACLGNHRAPPSIRLKIFTHKIYDVNKNTS